MILIYIFFFLEQFYEQVICYLIKKFESYNMTDYRMIYTHVVTGIDLEHMNFVFRACKDTVLRNSLACCGLMDDFAGISAAPTSRLLSTNVMNEKK